MNLSKFAVFALIIIMLPAWTCWFAGEEEPVKPKHEVKEFIQASRGGELILSDGAKLVIPKGSLPSDSEVRLQQLAPEQTPEDTYQFTLGSVYDIDIGNVTLLKPAYLEIPFDASLLPPDAERENVFISYYDEHRKEWVYAGGEVQLNRDVVSISITHASLWKLSTWNWEAWIAFLNKTLSLNISEVIDAVQLFTDDCPQQGQYAQVLKIQPSVFVQGCIEKDAEKPTLKLINPKSFYFEVMPISGGNGYPKQTLLGPGDSLEFQANTADPSPLVVSAVITEEAGWYLVGHMIITMLLPGLNQLSFQGEQLACITERLDDVSSFAAASEALVVEQDGLAAAQEIAEFLLDDDAVRRFLTAADDCSFGPAKTWSWKGIKTLGSSISTIMSATDVWANYLATGGGVCEINFEWKSENIDNPVQEIVKTPIVFMSSRNNGDILLIETNGDIKSLTNDNFRDEAPTWSPDGKKIAFVSDRGNGYLDIFVMYADGSGISNLTDNLNASNPAWSPDGKYIAFESYGKGHYDIFVMNSDGSGVKNLTDTDNAIDELGPIWSPDGKHIAFLAQGGGGQNIFVMQSNGSGFRNITNDSHFNGYPSWSPDGKKIAFESNRDGQSDIFVMNVDGSQVKNLSQNMAQDSNPAWSPDGRQIAFESDRNGNVEIYVMNSDGTNPTRLTDSPERDTSPAWRPQ